jgi:hypothetical protein
MILNSEPSQLVNNCQLNPDSLNSGGLPLSQAQCNVLMEWAWFYDARRGAGAATCAKFLLMRCRYCRARAGVLRTVCSPCALTIAIIDESAGSVGWTELIDIFAAKGLTKAQVDKVLDAEIDGSPTLRDRLTSRMANELMRSLGMPGRQSPEDVRRVRLGLACNSAGTWSAGQKPPSQT